MMWPCYTPTFRAVDTSEKTIEIRYKAIEVLRRQPDGAWKLIVGDPDGRE
jgi:ketosteroid isomerase-like protein